MTVPLTFDVISRAGVTCHAEGLERVVLRRREPGHLGSEIAVCARHAPMLMQTQACQARLVRPDGTARVDVPEGIAEIWHDAVTLVVSDS